MQKDPGTYKVINIKVQDPASVDGVSGQQITEIYKLEKNNKDEDIWVKYCETKIF